MEMEEKIPYHNPARPLAPFSGKPNRAQPK